MSAPSIPTPEVQQFGAIAANKATVIDMNATTLAVSGTSTTGPIITPSVTATVVTAPTVNATTEVVTPSVRSTGDLNLRAASDFIVCHNDLVQTAGQSLGTSVVPWPTAHITALTAGSVAATGAVTAASVAASGAVSGNTVASTAQMDANGGIYVQGPANTGFITTPAGKQLVVSSLAKTTAGAGASASMQIVGNAMYLNDGLAAEPSVELSSGNVLVNKVFYTGDSMFTSGKVQLGPYSGGYKGVLTSNSGSQLLLTANANEGEGTATAGNIQINGNVVNVFDGLSNTPTLSATANALISPRWTYGCICSGQNPGGTVIGGIWTWDIQTVITGAFGTRSSDFLQYVGPLNALTGFRVLVEGIYKIEVAATKGSGGVGEDALAITINGNQSAFGGDTFASCIVKLNANDTIGARGIGNVRQWSAGGRSLTIERMPGQYRIEFVQNGAATEYRDQ